MKNRLASEKSPYLRQHAENPVDWYPWGSEAFEKAKKENKPIFLSIGYSTCHWCHVMERESFVDQKVADALKKSFVSIKVDREERPQVDSIYMDIVQAMTGSGGWPMTVLMTPEGEPFFGGTYFPKETFLNILSQISEIWSKDPAQVRERTGSVMDWLKNQKTTPLAGQLTEDSLHAFVKSFQRSFDPDFGGRLGSPKFPPAYALRLLLRVHRKTRDPETLKMVEKTLDEMGRGGIYDHLGGGFHRYSTDEKWLIPHYEKMLYDQASLLYAYVEAFQVTKKKEYELIAREIADYVLREMTHPEGGFFSAEDADSEGEEGKFYVWLPSELKTLLTPEEFEALDHDFYLPSEGNFEGGTISLSLKPDASRENRSPVLKMALTKLYEFRAKRIRPLRDEKVLTEWNSLFIPALARAGMVFHVHRYVDGARRAGEFLLSRNRDQDGNLLRRFIGGEAAMPACLEDYAFFIDACIELLQVTSDSKWLKEAETLQAKQEVLFGDKENGGYFRTSALEPHLIVRRREYEDNVIPSGNSVAALNLLRLSQLTFSEKYVKASDRLFSSLPESVGKHPSAYPFLLMALDHKLTSPMELVISAKAESPELLKMRAEIARGFHPHLITLNNLSTNFGVPLLEGKNNESIDPLLFICSGKTCRPPTKDLNLVHGLLYTL